MKIIKLFSSIIFFKSVLITIIKQTYIIYLRIKRKTGKKPKKIKRRYIHPKLGVEGFFNAIRELDYVVLRWFESLPYVEEGEDIDILVSDAHLNELDRFLQGSKGFGVPCDIYTCGGLPGTDYRSVPYFPVKIAEKIVESGRILNDLVKVPDSKNHLFTMIYHVVYHKGFESGLGSQFTPPESTKKPDHDYKVILKDLAATAKIKIPARLTLESLDNFLFKSGWRPQNDTLKKLSKRNIWIEQRFFSAESELEHHWNGFTLFIIREKGMPFLDEIRNYLWNDGFDIILEHEIPAAKRETVSHNIRGGNWNRGPWPQSGGGPVYVIAAYDLHPLEVDKLLAEKHLGIENARISKTKIKIRDYVNSRLSKKEWCNVLHSADNPVEALDYASHLIPGKIKEIDRKIEKLNKSFQTPYPVIKNLSRHTRRAKIEIVDFKGVEAICKTFKPGRERFMEREIFAREIKGELANISEILESGSNYIVLKKYDDVLEDISFFREYNRLKKYLPVKIIKEARNIISHYRGLGYELVDFSPGNLIYDRTEGLKVIDFEFMQEGPCRVPDLKGCYAWYNIPEEFSGDRPRTGSTKSPYSVKWRAQTGLPRAFCVYNIPSPVLVLTQAASVVAISGYRVIFALFRSSKIMLKKYKSQLSEYLHKL